MANKHMERQHQIKMQIKTLKYPGTNTRMTTRENKQNEQYQLPAMLWNNSNSQALCKMTWKLFTNIHLWLSTHYLP